MINVDGTIITSLSMAEAAAIKESRVYQLNFSAINVRIFDCAGGMGLRLGQAIEAKLYYNDHRPDHSRDERAKDGGKRY